MDRFRKAYLQHFVEYNLCYNSVKFSYYGRYIGILLSWVVPGILIYGDDASVVCQEAKGITLTKIIIIAMVLLWIFFALFWPIWNRKRKSYSDNEELIVFQCIDYVLYSSLIEIIAVSLIYMTQGVIITGVVFVIALLSSIMGYIVCKHLVLKLIKRDGFNQNKKVPAFCRLKTYCDIVLGTKWLVVGLFGLGAIGKHSGFGVACMSFYCALIPTAMVILPACCNLQIKYAREYGLREYLPTKSVSEIKKEEEEELIKSVEETEK